MQEKLLQFLWQHSLYNTTGLHTADGLPLTVLRPGMLNTNAGPDFLEAKIKVGDTTLVGHVELHVNSSDWLKHGHQYDAAYSNIILHVVYRNDKDGVVDNTPVLELAPYIPDAILDKYRLLAETTVTIPCAASLASVRDITKTMWLQRMLAERWEEKLATWKELLDESAGDWRNLLYWRTAANFGFKINATPFLMLARSLPLNILGKHGDNLMQIEALLFGQAGMLEGEFKDEYPQQLQKEFTYLRRKYNLKPIAVHLWKFMRMRPANFPTVRIAQFAALVHKSMHLFSQIIETHSVKEIQPLLSVQASGYWNSHFRFDDESEQTGSAKKLGKSSILNIIINTVAPIQFLYAGKQGVSSQQEQALQLLNELPAEANNILELWAANNWAAENATQSQALLQLYNNYCSQKRCLECSVGHSIMRAS